MRLRAKLPEVLEHLGFGARVHRCRGLIEHQHVGAGAHEGARQGDLLPLAAREFASIAEPLAQLRLVTQRQLVDKFGGAPHRGRRAPAVLVLEMPLVADAHVFADLHLVAGEILEYHADSFAQCHLVPLAQVQALEADAPGSRRVQSREQFDQRGLARAVFSDQRQRAAWRKLQGDVLECRLARAWIGKAHILEANTRLRSRAPAGAGQWPARPACPGTRRAWTDTGCPHTCRRPRPASPPPPPVPDETAAGTWSSGRE